MIEIFRRKLHSDRLSHLVKRRCLTKDFSTKRVVLGLGSATMKIIACMINLYSLIELLLLSTKTLIEKLDKEALQIDFLTMMVRVSLKSQKCLNNNLQEDLKVEINQKSAVKEASLWSLRKNPWLRMTNSLILVWIEKKEKRISKNLILKGPAMFDIYQL